MTFPSDSSVSPVSARVSRGVSRRSLIHAGLGLSGSAAAALLLSACGSSNSGSQGSGNQGGSLSGSKSSANPHGYTDDGKNYSGTVEYTHFEGALDYEPGTVDHPPRNAPKPQVTDALSMNTVTGFHEAIAYFAAAMDYLVKTGSTEAFSTGITLASKTRSEVDALSTSILAGVDKGSWYVNPSASYALSSAQPSIMSDGNLLFKGQYTLDFGAEAVAEGKVQPPATLAKSVRRSVESLSAWIQRSTGGALDLSSLVAGVFIMRGVRQLVISNNTPSGSQMLWWALSLMRGWKV